MTTARQLRANRINARSSPDHDQMKAKHAQRKMRFDMGCQFQSQPIPNSAPKPRR